MQNRTRTMNWIEAISLTLRLPEDKSRLFNIIKEVRSSLSVQSNRQIKVSLYRNTKKSTDWAIHLKRDTSFRLPGKTGIGKDFAGIIGKLGQVEHAVWKKVPGTTKAVG